MVAEIRKTIRGEVRVTAAIAVLIESGLKPSQTNLLTTKQAKSPKKQVARWQCECHQRTRQPQTIFH